MVVQVNRKESSDQSDIIKAAAWAWYERGSWFEHKTIKETDFRRPQNYKPKPTRYKIEAMKQTQKPYHESKVVDSLLDMYEIERISRELNCYMESSRVAHRSRSIDGGDRGSRSMVSKETKSKRTGKKHNYWGWRRHGIVCGSNSDDGWMRWWLELRVFDEPPFMVDSDYGVQLDPKYICVTDEKQHD